MWLGLGLCHQLPERSFSGGGVQVPVCARDEGIYIGFVVALLFVSVLERGGKRSAGSPPWWVIVTMIGFLGVMALDGLTSYSGLRPTTNEIRLATGIMAGVALAVFTIPLVNGQLWRVPGRGKLLGDPRQFLGLLGVMIATYAVVFWGLPLLGVLYPVIVTVAILVTFTTVMLVVVCLFPPFERRADRLRDAWLPILLAFIAALVLLAIASGLKLAMLRSLGVESQSELAG
jgi:uncharacterized membrane protein